MRKYVLENFRPVLCDDLMTWGKWFEWFEQANRRVGDVEIGGVRVSTVFLGIDHNFSSVGPPLLFETMVFGSENDGEQARYSTHEEAMAGHNDMCGKVFRVRGVEVDAEKAISRDGLLGDPVTRLIREG